MGALSGLALGVGIVLILASFDPPRETAPARSRPSLRRWLDRNAAAGLSTGLFIVLGLGAGLLVATIMASLVGSALVAVVFGLAATVTPALAVRGRARRIVAEHRAAWPDAIDNLASAVRAGLSLSEALTQLGERGPEPLRPHFAAFGRDYARLGRFEPALDRLKERVADPVGDRVVETLRMARRVGGGDLGRVLRTLSAYLREDHRTRAELESRQAWAVNGARLAVAAPWFVLLMMSFQPAVVSRFSTGAGPFVLLGVGLICVVAYRLMIALGRLPVERRVLA